MKRHVAATLLGVLSLLIIDSHVDWVAQDNGSLLQVSGRQFDLRGRLAESWREWHTDCRLVQAEKPNSANAQAVLQAIQAHSMPDSLQAQLLQLQLQAPWAIAEVTFTSLNPSIVVLQQSDGQWHILDHAIWSGSTAPWLAADFVRRYLRQRAPQLPEALLNCVPIDPRRYASN